MEKITFEVHSREVNEKKPKHLRKEGIVPGIVYGQKTEPASVKLDEKKFIKLYKHAGENTVIELTIDGKNKQNVLIHEVAFNPVNERVMNVDFLVINMKEKVQTKVPVKFIGTAPAVKDLGGIFIIKKEEIEVECLPADLMPEVEVDISGLVNLHDNIRVKDVEFPNTIIVLDDVEMTLASIDIPRGVSDTVEETEEGAEGTAEEPETVEGAGSEQQAE